MKKGFTKPFFLPFVLKVFLGSELSQWKRALRSPFFCCFQSQWKRKRPFCRHSKKKANLFFDAGQLSPKTQKSTVNAEFFSKFFGVDRGKSQNLQKNNAQNLKCFKIFFFAKQSIREKFSKKMLFFWQRTMPFVAKKAKNTCRFSLCLAKSRLTLLEWSGCKPKWFFLT